MLLSSRQKVAVREGGRGCGCGRRDRATAVAGWGKRREVGNGLTENGNFTKCCGASWTAGASTRSSCHSAAQEQWPAHNSGVGRSNEAPVPMGHGGPQTPQVQHGCLWTRAPPARPPADPQLIAPGVDWLPAARLPAPQPQHAVCASCRLRRPVTQTSAVGCWASALQPAAQPSQAPLVTAPASSPGPGESR
jgi:hypothetical protein